MIYALFLLIAFQLLGEATVRLTGWPLPGALLGMLLLLGWLAWRRRVPESLQSTASTLLQHMMLLFIPTVTGVMVHFGRVAEEWKPFLIACVVGAAVTMAVTALTLHWLLARAKPAEPPA
ncbi:CidA/LrgA family protein [Paracidovorax valerianellae]|uniref:PEP-CTERM protein-sorting domain-containing protein n=1 Tax=Paracidovorax valerianellae TaxID=187868 RepID=A0A1G6WYA2_9BURK|nr:CidA/LrgA family protein [Paracidovorax valerianellae]MDA8447681.1 CidA/LrgA family protein [Paracidovorax valerianellae]SDD70789.1 PEP-CTERM protein-sorting domain-containing protein [Paracidovorax valerianellae]